MRLCVDAIDLKTNNFFFRRCYSTGLNNVLVCVYARKTVNAAPLPHTFSLLSLSLCLTLSHIHKLIENRREQIWARCPDGWTIPFRRIFICYFYSLVYSRQSISFDLNSSHTIFGGRALKMFVSFYIKLLTTWMSRNYMEWFANVSFHLNFFFQSELFIQRRDLFYFEWTSPVNKWIVTTWVRHSPM